MLGPQEALQNTKSQTNTLSLESMQVFVFICLCQDCTKEGHQRIGTSHHHHHQRDQGKPVSIPRYPAVR